MRTLMFSLRRVQHMHHSLHVGFPSTCPRLLGQHVHHRVLGVEEEVEYCENIFSLLPMWLSAMLDDVPMPNRACSCIGFRDCPENSRFCLTSSTPMVLSSGVLYMPLSLLHWNQRRLVQFIHLHTHSQDTHPNHASHPKQSCMLSQTHHTNRNSIHSTHNTMPSFVALAMALSAVSLLPATVEDRNVEMCMKTAMQTADLDPTTSDWNCGGSVLSPTCLDKTYIAAREGLVCVQEYSTAKQLKLFSMEALSTPTQSKATYECLYEKMKTCESSDEDRLCKDTHSCLEQVRCVMTQFNFCMKDDVWPVDKLRSKAEMAAFDVKPFTDCVRNTVDDRCDGEYGSACGIAVSFDCGVSKDLFPYFTSDAVPFFSHSASPECVKQSHAACLDGAGFCKKDSSVDLCLSQLKCTMEGINQCADYKFISPELIPTGVLTDVDCLSNFKEVCKIETPRVSTYTDWQGNNVTNHWTVTTLNVTCAAWTALYCTTAKPAMEKLKTDLKECVSEVKDTCGFGEPSEDWACAKMQGNSAMTTECYKMSSCALRSATQCINDAILLFFPDKPTTPVALPTSSPATAAPVTLAPPSVPATVEDRNVEMCMKTAMSTAGLDPTTSDWNCGGSVMSPMCLDKTYIAARQGLVCVQEYSTAKQLKVFSMEALSTPTQSKATYECLYEKMKTCESSDEDVFCKDTHSCLEQVRCVMTQFNFCMKDDVWPVDKLRSKAEMAAFDVKPFTDCVNTTVEDRCDGKEKYSSPCGIAVAFDCGVSQDLFPYFTSDAVPFFSHSASPDCVKQSHAACLDGAGFCKKDSSVDLCLSQLKCTMEGINQCADYKFISPELIPTGMLTDVDCLSSFNQLCETKTRRSSTYTDWQGYNRTQYWTDRSFNVTCAAWNALYCTTAKPAMEKLKTDLKECVSEVKDTCGFGEPSEDWACAKMQGNSAMTTGCYKMSSCALRSATQCINDAILLFFPDKSDETIAPATEAPATRVPLIVDEHSYAPDTDAPRTDTPTTRAPLSAAPDTEAPTTRAPLQPGEHSYAPDTDAPRTDTPATRAPLSAAPDTDAPRTDAPATKPPLSADEHSYAPDTDAPRTDAPATRAPLSADEHSYAPDTDAPRTDAPTTKPPLSADEHSYAPDTDAPTTRAPLQPGEHSYAPDTDAPVRQPPTGSAPLDSEDSSNTVMGVWIGIAVGGVLVVVLLTALLYLWKCRAKEVTFVSSEIQAGQNELPMLDLEEDEAALL